MWTKRPSASAWPQSNQRGIETTGTSISTPASARPQSNQRGIETLNSIQDPPSPASLNRTSVGLKHCFRWERGRCVSRPQSNQRGIETGGPGGPAGADDGRLNRTSVGLKRISERLKTAPSRGPQSNQRGIETLTSHMGWRNTISTPQSNQRGIETGDRIAPRPPPPRLNRTSVGLKLGWKFQQETVILGLNRTSVGLKLKYREDIKNGLIEP